MFREDTQSWASKILHEGVEEAQAREDAHSWASEILHQGMEEAQATWRGELRTVIPLKALVPDINSKLYLC